MRAFELSNVAREIYEYLCLHPGAKDSAEGIARWWVHADVPQVQEALEELAEKKLIGKRESTRRDLYYAVERGSDEPLIIPTKPTAKQNGETHNRIQPAKNLLDLTEEFASLNNAKILFGGQLQSQSESRWEELKNFYDALMGHEALTEPPLHHFPADDIKSRIQSRARLRVQAELGIAIKQNSRYQSARVLNVSCGGLLVATPKAPDVGSPLTLCLSSIGNGLVVDGEVMWSTDLKSSDSSFQDKMGVRFSKLQDTDRNKIDSFVIDVLEKRLITFDPAWLGQDFIHREQLVL